MSETPRFTVARPEPVTTAPEPESDDPGAYAPPQDLAAERAVLGSMLMDPDAIADCLEVVKADDFYRPAHEIIFDAIMALFGQGEAADVITVGDELNKRGDLNRVGGQAYLHQLVQSVATTANAGYYGEIVAKRAVLRRLVEAGTQIVQMGRGSGEGDVDDIVNRAQAAVFEIGRRAGGEDYQSMDVILDPTIEEIEAAGSRGDDEMHGVPTGFADLDDLLHGLKGGQMVIVAARPAVGKSTIGLDIARAAAFEHDCATVIFSLEMSRTEIGMRCISAEAQINLTSLRKGRLSDPEWGKIASVVNRMSNGLLFVDDSPNLTFPEIRTKARRLKQSHNLRLIVIDYLQLMSSGKKTESRQQEVSEFSRAIKLLAKELDVPVIAICQLNRGSEQRVDKKPMMSDLRESGSLEQDADIVMLLHRDDMYDRDSPRAGEADVIVAKHRNGPTRTIPLAFQGHYSRFADMAPEHSDF